MIFIFTESSDLLSNRIQDILSNNHVRINLDIDSVQFHCNIKKTNIPHILLNLNNITHVIGPRDCIWFRRGNLSSYIFVSKSTEPIIIDHIIEEKTYLEHFLIKRILNDYKTLGNPLIFKTNKLLILEAADNLGLKIPQTNISYSKNQIFNNNDGFVVKPFGDIFFKSIDDNLIMHSYVEEFKIDEIPSYFSSTLIQEKISSKIEVRALLIDDVCFAIEFSFLTKKHIDIRHDLNCNLKIKKHNIPFEIVSKLISLNNQLRNNFVVIDFILSDGEYYFIDYNPCAQIDEIENLYGNQIYQTIIRKLSSDEKNTRR